MVEEKRLIRHTFSLAMDQNRKGIEQEMIKKISIMPEIAQDRLKTLKALSDQAYELGDKFNDDIMFLEKKADIRTNSIYDVRRQIISGELLDLAEYTKKFDEKHQKLEKLCKRYVEIDKQGKPIEKKVQGKTTDVNHLIAIQGIPDFWSVAMRNNQMIFEIVKEKDAKILKQLKHIETLKNNEKPKSITVRFYFNSNEYFSHEKLEYKIIYKAQQNDHEDEVDRIEATQIIWNEGKDPTKKQIQKYQNHKNEIRTITKIVEDESFFNVFTSLAAPDKNFHLDSDEENEMQHKIDVAVNLAEDISDILLPDALEYYLGLNDDLLESSSSDGDDNGDNDGKVKKQEDDKQEGGKKNELSKDSSSLKESFSDSQVISKQSDDRQK